MIIRDANEQDISEIEKISDQAFGQGYYSKSNIIFSNSNIINLVSVIENKVVGFAIGFVENENYLINLNPPTEILISAQNYKLGVIKTLAVLEEFQGQKIGKFLFFELEQRLKNLKSESFMVPAWKADGKIYLQNILDKFNYKPFYEDSPWKGICDSGSYKCLLRKNNCSCSCSCVYYYK